MKHRKTEPALDRLLGGIPPDASIVVYGPPGCGKSRLCLRWASLLGPSAVLSREMGPVELARTLSTCGARSDRLMVAPSVEVAAASVRRGLVVSVVVDSVQRLGPGELPQVLGAARAGVWWLISHVNAAGRAKGTTDASHDCSAVLSVSPAEPGRARVTIEKTRLGGASGLSELFDLAPEAPQKKAASKPVRGRQR